MNAKSRRDDAQGDRAGLRASPVTWVLDELDYTSLEAADGPGALKLLQGEGRIDLLITDVGLPGGLNGREIADAARLNRPDLKSS